ILQVREGVTNSVNGVREGHENPDGSRIAANLPGAIASSINLESDCPESAPRLLPRFALVFEFAALFTGLPLAYRIAPPAAKNERPGHDGRAL
ncbi:MAG: hypothetical protein WCF17_13735, partial [Terracidiphilus sp.]